jgi:hypothetical protein
VSTWINTRSAVCPWLLRLVTAYPWSRRALLDYSHKLARARGHHRYHACRTSQRSRQAKAENNRKDDAGDCEHQQRQMKDGVCRRRLRFEDAGNLRGGPTEHRSTMGQRATQRFPLCFSPSCEFARCISFASSRCPAAARNGRLGSLFALRARDQQLY